MKVTIDGIGEVDVDDGFANLTPEQQGIEIDAIAAYIQANPKPGPKTPIDEAEDYDFVGQTIGGIGGAAGGLAAGVAFAPLTFGLSVPILTALGAGIGGSGGEYLEQLYDNWSNDDKENWKKLSAEQRNEVFGAAVEEGIFGIIPGVGSWLGKGYKAVKAARAPQKAANWLSGLIASIVPGVGPITTLAATAAKLADSGVTSKLHAGLDVLSDKARNEVLEPLFEAINKRLPKDIPAKGGWGKPKTKQVTGYEQVFGSQHDKILRTGYGAADTKPMFDLLITNEVGQKALMDWFNTLPGRKFLKNAGLETMRNDVYKLLLGGQAAKTVATNSGLYNKGGKVDPLGDKIGILKDEGYPTKQAVAIAYDMRRRGELR